MPVEVLVQGRQKYLRSPEINYVFDMRSGFHAVWGTHAADDPDWSPYGPFIADVEVTTACRGVAGSLCDYCYKANTPAGKNMSLPVFQRVIENINFSGQLTQVAFGLDAAAESNPALWDMSEWLRTQDIVPNGTVAAISADTARAIAALWGACAVSLHGRRDICYDTIALLAGHIDAPGATLRQVNMHLVVYEELYRDIPGILDDIQHDPRLERLNAVVFLSLKRKGRAVNGGRYSPLSQEHYGALVSACMERHISFGSDSCGCHKVAAAIRGRPDERRLSAMLEPCEGLCMSAYANVDGVFSPCSFLEGSADGDIPSLNLLTDDFAPFWCADPQVIAYRQRLIEHGRECPRFAV